MKHALYVLLHGFLLVLCGCASRGNVELLESELRQQEDRYYALTHELRAVRSELEIARQETELLRTRQVNHSGTALLPEQTRSLVRMSELSINKLFTGGLDRDGQPGDEAFAVLLNPLDSDGEVIKLPGQVDIVLLDLEQNQDGLPIGRWSFTAEQTREKWHAGLSQGFLFRLPWQQTPAGSELILHARFETADGRQFKASHPLEITPPNRSTEPKTQVALPPAPPIELPEQAAVVPEVKPVPERTAFEPAFDLAPTPIPQQEETEPIVEMPIAPPPVDSVSFEGEPEMVEAKSEQAPPFPIHLDALEMAKIPDVPEELPLPSTPDESPFSMGTASVQLSASNRKDGKPNSSASWKPTAKKSAATER